MFSLANVRRWLRTPSMPARTAFRPGFDSLEDRQCLSVTVATAANDPSTLIIKGSAANDKVFINQDDVANTFKVSGTGLAEQTFTSSQIQKVVIKMKGGNDDVNYLLKSLEFTHAKRFEVDLGAGCDDASFVLSSAIDAEQRTINADLQILVGVQTPDIANPNNDESDSVGVGLGHIGDANVEVTTQLGDGNDHFVGVMWGKQLAGTGSVTFDAAGENGKDTLFVNHKSAWSILPGGSFDVRLSGGAGADHLSFDYDGTMQGDLNVEIHGDGGNDKLLVDMLFLDKSNGTLNAALFGDVGNDTVNLGVGGDVDELDFAQSLADGGFGFDTTNLAPNPYVTKVSIEEVKIV